MKKFIWISLLILLSCGSRTSKVNKESEKTNTESFETKKSEGTQKTELSSQTESNILSKSKLVDMGFGFSINPINGQNSFFNLISGKDTLSLQTNAQINFNKNNKTEERRTVEKHKTITTYKTFTTYKTKTTYKTQTTYQFEKKNKETDRKAYPVILWIGLGIIITILAQLLWKVYKPKL